MPRIITVVHDTVANEVVGGAQMFNHTAPAIRFFGDLAGRRDTAVGLHVEDYQLVSLGTVEITDDGRIGIEPYTEVLITGAQWKAAQANNQEGRNQ